MCSEKIAYFTAFSVQLRLNSYVMVLFRGIKNPTKWSECSKQQFADSFHQGMDYCLHDLPERLYDGPVCGNGFTEAGEQCDCGMPQVSL